MSTALFDADLFSHDCIFCGHHHPDVDFCDAPVCGDGCCHCGCSEFLPLEAGEVRRFIAGLQAELATSERQLRKVTKDLEEKTRRYKVVFGNWNTEIERRAEVERRLAKAEKKLGKR